MMDSCVSCSFPGRQAALGGLSLEIIEAQSVAEVVSDTVTETVTGPIEEILLEAY